MLVLEQRLSMTSEVLNLATKIAFEEALEAKNENEIPVGSVILLKNKIITREHNRIIQKNDPTAHAEILCLQKASFILKNERLVGTTLITTLEPCMMCSGAIILARIEKVIFMAQDEKLPGLRELIKFKGHNHIPEIEYFPTIEFDASQLIKDFFRDRR